MVAVVDKYMNQIIHGDCLKVMKNIPDNSFDTIYTDPVWPNSTVEEFKNINAFKLFKRAAREFSRIAKRCLVHLGVDSDPRILQFIPTSFTFFRIINLKYARPHFKGRVLYDRDIVYAFGPPVKSRPGNHAPSGSYCYIKSGESKHGHPCPRRLDHVRFVLERYAEGPVLDPFAGSCTTAEACVEVGLPYCCIEIVKKYCDEGEKRIIKQAERGIQLKL